MTVKNTLYRCLLNYASIYPNALDVYIELFLVIGNGYEWKNGEIVKKDKKGRDAKNMEHAIIQYCNDDLHNKYVDEILQRLPASVRKKMQKGIEDGHAEVVKRIIHTEERMKDFRVRRGENKSAVNLRQETYFYPVCNYSLICSIPDDVKGDWLNAAEDLYNIMLDNMDLVEDSENWLPEIGKRIECLKTKIDIK